MYRYHSHILYFTLRIKVMLEIRENYINTSFPNRNLQSSHYDVLHLGHPWSLREFKCALYSTADPVRTITQDTATDTCPIGHPVPSSRKRWPVVCSMLVQRHILWPNIVSMQGKAAVVALDGVEDPVGRNLHQQDKQHLEIKARPDHSQTSPPTQNCTPVQPTSHAI